MKRTLINIAILSTILGAGMAQAGGFDVSGQDTSIILKEGNLLEITSVSVNPSVTGTYSSASSGGAISDVAPDYSFVNLAFRTDISDQMSLAIVQDQPFGANVNWTDGITHNPLLGETGLSYNGVKAKITSSATTALVSYSLADNITVYGGVKNQSVGASASNPVVGNYTITSNTDSSMGYVVGAAIEKPEIAMRVAFTYHSKVGHDLAIVEANAAGVEPSATLSFDTPEAFNLDFQTGVAENTLLFGTIRHVKWTQFALTPSLYKSKTGGALKDFDHNPTTYSIGLGRKLNDQWSAAVTYGTESATGDDGSALGPTDGFNKMGVGVTYSGEKVSLTLGVQKANLGDTTIPLKYTEAPSIATPAGRSISKTEMSGNTTLVTALKVGYKF
jgi:long-subunit fatty acid transport protein